MLVCYTKGKVVVNFNILLCGKKWGIVILRSITRSQLKSTLFVSVPFSDSMIIILSTDAILMKIYYPSSDKILYENCYLCGFLGVFFSTVILFYQCSTYQRIWLQRLPVFFFILSNLVINSPTNLCATLTSYQSRFL